MSRFGWAYVNDILTGSTAGGTDKSVQFNSGSAFSGSSNFTFDYTTNTVYLTGTLRADTLIVSSSQIFKSGSTIFGDSSGDTHQFTGSMSVSGTATFTNQITVSSNGANITGPTTITNGNLQVINGAISSSNALQSAGQLTVAGLSSLNGGVNVIGNLSGSGNFQVGGSLTVASTTTLSGNTDIYAITQVRNNTFNVVSSSTVNASIDQNGNISGSGQLQIGTNITLGNNLTMNGPLFTSAGEVRVKNQIVKVTDAAGTTTKSYIDNNGDVSGSRNLSIGSNATIGGDVTVAGTYLGSGGIKGAYNTYNSNFTVGKASYFVGISSIGGAITASLDSAAEYQAGQTLIFKDTGGAAGTNNILIKPSGSQTIDGATGGALISTNSGSLTLVSNGSNQFYIVASR